MGAPEKYQCLELPRLLAIILLCSAASAAALNFNDTGSEDELAKNITEALNNEELLAQTFMFGWKDSEGSPSREILEWISKRGIGGVKVFGWNSGNLEKLARTIGLFQNSALSGSSAAAAFDIPLFVATDQEGGFVRHIKGATSDTPGAMAIGASGFPEDARRSGYYIGRELSVIGINMNFAPTVDLFTNHNSLLIGSRSFGDDPVKTGLLAIAFFRGLLAAGIIPTAKHFPGHGDTALDSHGILPQINAGFDTLWKRELVPYRMLVKEGIPAIMSGHIAFPNTEAKTASASLSPYFLKTVLREKIGFQGLIVTDDLAMNGATSRSGSLSETAKEALLAGNNIIMISQTPPLNAPLWTGLLAAMKDEPEFRQQVKDSVEKIIKAKLKYLRTKTAGASPYIPDPARIRTEIPDKEGTEFFLNLAARSVTFVRNRNGALPLPPERAGKVLLAGQNLDFFKTGRAAYPGAKACWYSAQTRSLFLDMARDADTVIFYLETTEGPSFLNALRPLGRRVIVFSVLSPAMLEALPWVDGALAVYSVSGESLTAGFSALTGSIEAAGTLPFKLKE